MSGASRRRAQAEAEAVLGDVKKLDATQQAITAETKRQLRTKRQTYLPPWWGEDDFGETDKSSARRSKQAQHELERRRAGPSETAAPKKTGHKETTHNQQVKQERAIGQAGPSETAAPKKAAHKESAPQDRARKEEDPRKAAVEASMRNHAQIRQERARQEAVQAPLLRETHLMAERTREPAHDMAAARAASMEAAQRAAVQEGLARKERVRLEADLQHAAREEATRLQRTCEPAIHFFRADLLTIEDHILDCCLDLAEDPTSEVLLRRLSLEKAAVELDAICRKGEKRKFGGRSSKETM
ncbi:uncharacterized protein BKA78DRAFT_294341 [Phyllosticta capitalensis]|uniref:uncharacterized protein n=1 Tax=Phyllosticta capitalensis TaxID=121624 RepID=UPI00312D3CEA